MIYRKLDSNRDYVLGLNMQGFLSGAAATAQVISTSLRLLLGEWFEAVNQGFPLFQSILGKAGTPSGLQTVNLIIQNYIANVPTVASVSAYVGTFNKQARSYSFTCQVTTSSGQTFAYSDTVGMGVTS